MSPSPINFPNFIQTFQLVSTVDWTYLHPQIRGASINTINSHPHPSQPSSKRLPSSCEIVPLALQSAQGTSSDMSHKVNTAACVTFSRIKQFSQPMRPCSLVPICRSANTQMKIFATQPTLSALFCLPAPFQFKGWIFLSKSTFTNSRR